MDMTPVFKASATPPQTPESVGQRVAGSRPFISVPAPVASQSAGQPTQVFVPQGTSQAQVQVNPNPAAMTGQPLPGQFERVVSQVISFFFGDKKDKSEEKELRKRNDYAKTGLMGEERKVEESNKSDLGGGQS